MAESASGSQWDDFEISKDDVRNITEALKKEEFRKLLLDYVEEVNDPENRKKYQEEITVLERERGYDVAFINPLPGYVIKTSADGKKKAFINVCKSDKLQKPTSVPVTKSGAKGSNWSLPYSQIQPRDDLDKSGKRCVVYDVVFHPDTHELAKTSKQFKNMLTETALDAIESNFSVKLDRKNLKFPKIKYKGAMSNSVLRKKSENPPDVIIDDDHLRTINYPYFMHEGSVKPKERKDKSQKIPVRAEQDIDNTPYTSPTYMIKYRSPVDMQEYVNDKSAKMNAAIPKELVIEVNLPLLSSSSDVALDVTEESVTLKNEKHAKYQLELKLPYKVNEESGNAKFDKDQKKLIITLPVRHLKERQLADIGREDSGVESDVGCQTPESGSGDDVYAESESQKNVENTCFDKSVLLDDCVENDRTNTDNVNLFLDPDKHYLLPSFNCNTFDGVIAFTLHVKNVDPSSVVHRFLEDYCGVAVKFISLGSGHFPVYYVLYIKFPARNVLQEDCLNIETWDNNVVMQMRLMSCDYIPVEFYAGSNEDSLVKHDIPEPAAIAKLLEKLKKTATQTPQSHMEAEVTEVTEDMLLLEVKSDKKQQSNGSSSLEQAEELKDDELNNGSSAEEQADELKDDELNNSTSDRLFGHKRLPLMKSRTFSESSGDDINLSPRKGILKHPGRVCRSLSESSADDYSWASSLDIVGQSGGSDSCIPEEEEEGETEHKKTVRFNDDISEKIYRSNSSILGQRKKNQRKIRNKKRAQERRASESENSEGEADKDKEKESDIENDRKTLVVEVHEQFKAEPNLDITVGEHDECRTDPEQSATMIQCQEKSNYVSGKSVLMCGTPAVTQLELDNDLVSQLSM